MLNQIVLVGNIKSIAYNKKNKEGSLYLEVKRFTKNDSGEYETDVFKINTSDNLIKNIDSYCKIGDLIGIKGYLKANCKDNVCILANKITLLCTNKNGGVC